jgi:hypothetical protein
MKFNLDSPEFNPLGGAALPAVAELNVRLVEPAAEAAPTAVAEPADLRPYVQALAQHGGVYRLLDPKFVAAITQRVAQHHQEAGRAVQPLQQVLTDKIPYIFTHLANQLPGGNRPYVLDSSLLSHLTFPHEGRTYSPKGDNKENPHVPAFMTFTGQFIDHDLTLNPVNLFDSQMGTVASDASPIIDLDSVYGRDEHDNMLAHGTRDDIFNPDGTFKLRPVPDAHGQPQKNAFDLVRDPTPGMYHNKPFMYDLRNDENQMVLQIHILIARLHNKLVSQLTTEEKASLKGRDAIIAYVQREVLNNWQSFVLDDYLPTVVSADALAWVLTEIKKPGYGGLHHKPAADGMVSMPHEFAIGFRMGHSQLRDGYQVQPQQPHIPLFINQQVDADDLRGSRPLIASHVINWPFFSAPTVHSNQIDRLVTSAVFDLPQSTIPDQVKQIGNLPQRNLIRSSQVELAAGEDLADLYRIEYPQRLRPEEVEPDAEKRKLFQLANDGTYAAQNRFRTPLWYYVLQEAGLRTTGKQLGPLGGRIVAEVVVGGIYYMPGSVVYQPNWKSRITGSRVVKFADLVKFVTE